MTGDDTKEIGDQGVQKVVFIDRDGTINDNVAGYVRTWSDFRFNPGAILGLKILCDAGYKVVIISNQACVGDEVISEDDLLDIHSRMLSVLSRFSLKIFRTMYCLHGKYEGCSCRKPKTGLFVKFGELTALNYVRRDTWMIGDRPMDIQAGMAFGLRTALVRTGYGRSAERETRKDSVPDAVYNNLLEAADAIVKEEVRA